MVLADSSLLVTDTAIALPPVTLPSLKTLEELETEARRICGVFRANGAIVDFGKMDVRHADVADITETLQQDEMVILIPHYWHSVFSEPTILDLKRLSEEGIGSISPWEQRSFSIGAPQLLPAARTDFLIAKAAWTITHKDGLRKVRQPCEEVRLTYGASSPLYYATPNGEVRFTERCKLRERLENLEWAVAELRTAHA